MYKIFFANRYISFLASDKNLQEQDPSIRYCKNSKSFDMAYSEFEKDHAISHLEIICSNPDKLFRHFSKKFKVIKAAGGLVENANGEILVIRRNGMWDLPKGKLEKSEKKKKAALREVNEECGISNLSITSKIGKSYHTYFIEETPILKVTYWYKMIYADTKVAVPQTEEGISEIKWANKAELAEIMELAYPNLRSIMETAL